MSPETDLNLNMIAPARVEDTAHPVISPGILLSGVSLPSWPNGAMVNLRSGHGPRALVTLHSAVCQACWRYVMALGSEADRLAEWGGRLAVIVPDHVESGNELAKTALDTAQVLADPERKLASGRAMVVVADEWGEVYFVANAEAGHDLPTSPEIADWVRFLAIQCPECEGPEGEWRTVDLQR